MAGLSLRRRARIRQWIDTFCFVFAGLAAVWLAILLLSDTWSLGWFTIFGLLAFWALLAYLVLPRLTRIITSIYTPDYFIGRARTSDGLLGDPINLAVLGSGETLHEVMSKAGWTRADEVSLATSWRIITSTLTRRSYSEAPVSPLYLFGRIQDVAYQQEVDGNPAKRHHVRFWRCPPGWLLPGGTRVDWLAAGTFDRAVGLSLFTLQVTHKIEADIDVERDHIVATVLRGAPGTRVHLLKEFSTGYHSRNGGGDSVHTDGDLPVIVLPRAQDEEPLPAPSGSRVVELREVSAERQAAIADMVRGEHDSKRGAFENPRGEEVESEIAELRDQAPPGEIEAHQHANSGRPATIVFGVVTAFLRALAIGAFVLYLAITGEDGLRTMLSSLGADAAFDADPATWSGLLVLGALSALVPAAFGVAVLRGVDSARLLVLVAGCLSISSQFVAWWSGGVRIELGLSLAVLAMDILTLLALSGKPAREFCRRPRPARPRRRAAATTLGG